MYQKQNKTKLLGKTYNEYSPMGCDAMLQELRRDVLPILSSWSISPHLKNISQNGNLPQIGVKIKNI